MTDDVTQPDNAGNQPRNAQGEADGIGGRFYRQPAPDAPSGRENPSRSHDMARLDLLATETEDATSKGCVTMLVATEDMARLIARSTRLAQVEANAEVLIVARHDLMVEVDQTTARLREAHGDIPFGNATIDAGHAEQAEKLLDRLAAYMKGQDDRIVAVGDQLDGIRHDKDAAERAYDDLRKRHDATLLPIPDNWRETGAPTIEAHAADLIGIAVSFMENLASALQGKAFKGWHPADDPAEFVLDAVNRVEEAEQLVMDCYPAIRLVNDWATWSDASLYAYADAILRKVLPDAPARDAIVDALAEIRRVARDRLGDDGFTIPPAYDDAMRNKAIRMLSNMTGGPGEAGRSVAASIVDSVAQVLGMRRAGA